jgi:preprotein translocase subunit YajC
MDVQANGFKNTLVALGPIVIFMVMIFFLFRSQQKENKRKREMVASIKSGDKVITAGGIHGIVANVKENTFIVKIADNVKIEVNKSGVISVMEKDAKENK